MRANSKNSTRRPTAPSRRYLALVFPWLPVERLRNARPHLFVGRDERPTAFVERHGNAIRLASLDRAATAIGLRAGLTLADARAQVPELDVFNADPHADHAWLEQLAEACARYTPTVALDAPDGLTLDITGCVHAFEGERPLAADVERRMARRGVMARHAFGDTPAIARALARFTGAPAPDERQAVRRLPVAALELGADTTEALQRAGLKTVGDVMARPLSALASRFGEEATAAVRHLSGEAVTPVIARRTASPIVVERRFAEPVSSADYALQIIGQLAGEAADALEKRGEGGRRWEVRLFRTDGQVRSLRVETGCPTRDIPLLMRLFAERVEALADPLDPGFGYDLIRLALVLTEPLEASQLKLEGGAARRGELTDLVDRLTTRLGRSRVRRFAPVDSHIPEQAELTLPAAEPVTPQHWPAPEPGEPPLRPIYLFDPPQPIDTIAAETPDGPPARFRWHRTVHDVARVEGPERIVGEWWRRHDTPVPTRDYFRVEDRRGRRFWIFRHGLYAETDTPRWYMHGVFA